jgi:hypothetical protein
VDNSPNDGFAESYARLRPAKNASLCDVLFVRPAKLAEKEAAPPPSLEEGSLRLTKRMGKNSHACRPLRFICPLRATGTFLQGVGTRHAQASPCAWLRSRYAPLQAEPLHPFYEVKRRRLRKDVNFSHYPAPNRDKESERGEARPRA